MRGDAASILYKTQALHEKNVFLPDMYAEERHGDETGAGGKYIYIDRRKKDDLRCSMEVWTTKTIDNAKPSTK
jgi:hypothetical protein